MPISRVPARRVRKMFTSTLLFIRIVYLNLLAIVDPGARHSGDGAAGRRIFLPEPAEQ